MTEISKKPKVSVCVVTYNQEKYIRQCLQSIVDQKTNFDFEVIVGEDCSTDGTRAIVMEFAERYPTIIRPLYQEKNAGSSKNFLDVHAVARGQYIAHVDGDDYTLPNKLQVQSDFLDKHPECNIVWHRMYLLNGKTGEMVEDLLDVNRLPHNRFTRSDVIRFVAIGTNSSKMYRSEIGRFEVPDFPLLDFFTHVEHVGTGIACIAGERPLGVYRVGIGIESSGNATKILLKKSFIYFLKKYPHHRRDINAAAIIRFLAALMDKRWGDCRLFLGVIVKTFHIGSLFDIWRSRSVLFMLRLPESIRTKRPG